MFTKCPMCAKTVFTLFGSIKTCPRCGSELFTRQAMPDNIQADSGLRFPQRENASCEDLLKEQIAQSFEGGSIGDSTVLGSWDDVLLKRPFDAPFFTALNDRACILVYFSSQSLGSEGTLTDLLHAGVQLPLQIETFLGRQFPILRCSLVIPDDPTSPFVLEAALNIFDGDVQDFCRAALASESIDFIVKHEDSQTGHYYSAGYQAPGLSMVMEREMKRALRALPSNATRQDFMASAREMLNVFPNATSGVDPYKCINLKVSEKARNEFMQIESSHNSTLR